MKFASHYRIAGIGDIKTKKDGAIFLPFWLLTYDEMQSVFVDRSGDNAPNQALALMDSVVEMKRSAIDSLAKPEVTGRIYSRYAGSVQIGRPLAFARCEKMKKCQDSGEVYKQGDQKGQPKLVNGAQGKLSRFLIRLKTKMNDRRYAFMYQAPEEYETYEALHELAENCSAHRQRQRWRQSRHQDHRLLRGAFGHPSGGGGLSREADYQIQFWSSPGEDGDARHRLSSSAMRHTSTCLKQCGLPPGR